MATLSVLQTQTQYKATNVHLFTFIWLLVVFSQDIFIRQNMLTKYDSMIFINTIILGKGIGRNIESIGMIGIFNHIATSGRGRL